MRLKNLTKSVIGVACAGLVLAACSSSPTSSAGSSTASTVAVKSGSSITYALDEDIAGFNVNNAASNEFVTGVVDNLVWPAVWILNPAEQPVLNTDLLESATQTSSSPQTVVYKINPKAKWADGQPIDAEDFWYQWESQNGSSSVNDTNGQPFQASSSTGWDLISSVTGSNPPNGAACKSASITGIPQAISCANGDTVTMVYSSPFADWRELMAQANPIVPAHIGAKVGWNTGFNDFHNVLSGGPYEISNYVENQYVVLKKNPSYWGTPGNLDTITFEIFNGDQQAVPAMQNNEVQIINPIEVDLTVVQQADQLSGVTKSLVPGLQFQHIDFNESDYYLGQVGVRQAIAYGTDRSQIVQRTVGEYDPKIVPDGSHIFLPGEPGYQNDGSAYDTANVAKAKSLLQAAGMTMGADGYFQPSAGPQKGQDLTFTLKSTTGNTLRADIEQLFQTQMKAIGVKIVIANEDAATLFGTDGPKGNFQMILFAWDIAPFASALQSTYCSYTNASQCAENWDHYADSQVDKLMNEGDSATTSTQEQADYNQADKLMWQDMVTLPLFQEPVFVVWSNKYGNIANNATLAGPTWNAQQWGVKAS